MDFQASHPFSDSFAPRLASVSHEAQLRNHRLLLHRLYVTENKTMKAVMDYMETHFQLRAGASTYMRIFREMNIRKNAKGNHWAYVDDRIRKRQSQGKESLVYAQGRLVEPKKVKKEIARHVTTLQQITSATGPGPASPDGWSVATPGNENDAATERPEDETMMLDDDGTTTIPDAQASEATRSNATAPSYINQPINRTGGTSLIKLHLQASKGPSYYRRFKRPSVTTFVETTMEGFEDEPRMIPDNRTLTMPDKSTAETVTGNATAPPDANHPRYKAGVASLLRLQLQASGDFYDALPAPAPEVDYYCSAMKPRFQGAGVSYDIHSPPTRRATYYQVDDLANRLWGFQALPTFFKSSGPLNSSRSWNLPQYRDIAGNILSVLRMQVLGPRLSSCQLLGEAIHFIACTMKNNSDLLRAAFTSANETLRRKELDDVLDTSLYLAATYGLAAAAHTLVLLGADANKMDLGGNTSCEVASDNNHDDIVSLLRHHIAVPLRSFPVVSLENENEPTNPVKTESGMNMDKPRSAVGIAREGSAGSGPYGFHKWFDSVVMPWAQRNWDSLGSSFSMGSFRVKLHSRPSSK